ncbi:MAG: 5-deoxy-glucuronate isomerase [Bifidobacteriaceae bacterium]|jgi:5-deoxy-glucuronate isomerase|nr:5-deoxy-glucuronate isomerase [Bifidobacteriaceae bacterium]
MATWHHPKSAADTEGWTTVVGANTEGWEHTGLRVGELGAGGRLDLPAAPVERIVVPLTGAFDVLPDSGGQIRLDGRPSVWSGPSDIAYVGPGQGFAITGQGRVAVAEAAAAEPRPARRLAAADIPVELRGAGASSREVRNFGTPGVLEAEAIIACEVLTPAGNWSSYPPHKHDEELEGRETELEEIYYFELRPTVQGAGDPIGYQRVSASPGRDIDVLAEVRDGDVVLVPFGWHGPSMAAPGYDMYYLNVMAGPGRERAWRISDHPDHAWVRRTWEGQPVDPRLPFGSGTR